MNDYADYVIKDGRFIGDFETMYKNCDDPWHQSDDIINSYSKMSCIASLARIGAKNILEIGCGLGYFTAFVDKMLPSSKITGVDISETAVKRAQILFPNISFLVGDVSRIDRIISDGKMLRGGMMQSFFQKFYGTFWYNCQM